jgi:hypothetical protein
MASGSKNDMRQRIPGKISDAAMQCGVLDASGESALAARFREIMGALTAILYAEVFPLAVRGGEDDVEGVVVALLEAVGCCWAGRVDGLRNLCSCCWGYPTYTLQASPTTNLGSFDIVPQRLYPSNGRRRRKVSSKWKSGAGK